MSDPHRDARSTHPRPPSDELVLAAVERAGRHRAPGAARDTHAVPRWSILDHLGLRRRSAAARHVRARLDLLEQAGRLARSRRHGIPTWELTDGGRERLRLARDGGEPLRLPESPQHRAWHTARTAAEQEIERFRDSLRECLQGATMLLDASAPPRSDAWFELAEQLQRACRRVASASYCLHEWVEPDDAEADVDDGLDPAEESLDAAERARRRARRAGRRNIRLWQERSHS
jgi:hypothetical protein